MTHIFLQIGCRKTHQLRFFVKDFIAAFPHGDFWGGCLAGFCDLCSTWDDLLPPKSSYIPNPRYVRWKCSQLTCKTVRFPPCNKKNAPIPRNQVQVPSHNLGASDSSPLKKTLWLIEENSWGSFLLCTWYQAFEESENIYKLPIQVYRIQSRWEVC